MKKLLEYIPEENGSRAAWARERIRPFREYTLQTIVPAGFAKYVRLCQPAWRWPEIDPQDAQAFANIASGQYGWEHATQVRWSQVASETGNTAHRLMQWYAIAPPPWEPGEGGISAPIEYEITPQMVTALFDILIDFFGKQQECLCAFWEGYADQEELLAAKNTRVSGLGQQSYFLFHAPLASVQAQWLAVLADRWETSGLAPNAVWPTSEEWYYSVPIGPHTSYLGGPAELVDAIRSCTELETYEAFPLDDIWRDPLNPPVREDPPN
ncbi:MAG: hypothetical protein V2I66_00855 [Halieaceae bacterium]|jgi:hypothetical protein|nr:hypothetical protein [Halieaceae bacterium]